ncbi:unnamed protein product [Callosobruchus maculatus]|uniref:Carboxylesterase type B domain-containing protein n=1 Tax=Callosobruchus maculatus TaxID=64391 RepID=A0A653CHT0_CALMS|nr:unnamed protein product [Callosobruchus maculatus]
MMFLLTSILLLVPAHAFAYCNEPEPVQPWDGIYNATGVKKKCLQDPVLQVGRVLGTEDCLVLNVYTPMVF